MDVFRGAKGAYLGQFPRRRRGFSPPPRFGEGAGGRGLGRGEKSIIFLPPLRLGEGGRGGEVYGGATARRPHPLTPSPKRGGGTGQDRVGSPRPDPTP